MSRSKVLILFPTDTHNAESRENEALLVNESVVQDKIDYEIPGLNPDAIIIEETFNIRQGIILNENWIESFKYDSKIISIDNEVVVCECLIDKENLKFQNRTFPKFLFDHIKPLREGQYIWIKVLGKPGSTRIDIIDAKNNIEKSYFDINKGWDEFDNSDFGETINLK